MDAIAADIQALQNQGISQSDLYEIIGRAEAYTDRLYEEHLAEINPHQLTPETIGALRSTLFE